MASHLLVTTICIFKVKLPPSMMYLLHLIDPTSCAKTSHQPVDQLVPSKIHDVVFQENSKNLLFKTTVGMFSSINSFTFKSFDYIPPHFAYGFNMFKAMFFPMTPNPITPILLIFISPHNNRNTFWNYYCC